MLQRSFAGEHTQIASEYEGPSDLDSHHRIVVQLPLSFCFLEDIES
jgi:hypothetical protein